MMDNMSPRDRRAVILGASLLGAIALVWLVLLPWWDHWTLSRQHIAESRERLDEFQRQTQRLISMDRELEPIVGAAVKKPLLGADAARTQLIKELTDLHQQAGAEIRSVTPEAVRPVPQMPGIVRLSAQVQTACPPAQLVQLLAAARNSSTLLLIDRVEASTGGGGGPGGMPGGGGGGGPGMPFNVTIVWSTLARQEAATP